MEYYRTNRTLQRHSWARPPTTNSITNTHHMLNDRVKIVHQIISPAWSDNSS